MVMLNVVILSVVASLQHLYINWLFFRISVTRLGKILLFGYFLLEQYLDFQRNKQLQNMVCCTYYNNQKELGVDVLDFQFERGFFGYSLGYISKYWANFFSIFWSLCSESIG
jgi:hypothetical protein